MVGKVGKSNPEGLSIFQSRTVPFASAASPFYIPTNGTPSATSDAAAPGSGQCPQYSLALPIPVGHRIGHRKDCECGLTRLRLYLISAELVGKCEQTIAQGPRLLPAVPRPPMPSPPAAVRYTTADRECESARTAGPPPPLAVAIHTTPECQHAIGVDGVPPPPPFHI